MFHVKHFDQDETIAAIATPLGSGGVGVIRVSGGSSKDILKTLFVSSNGAGIDSHKMLYGWLVDPGSKAKVDQILACYMKSPKSFTGEDVVELYCHGGIAVLEKALGLALAAGARLATKGEFTKRAFVNGKLDLAQAEGVLDLVKSRTAKGAGYAVQQLDGKLSKAVSEIRQELLETLTELEGLIDFPDDFPEVEYDQLNRRLKGVLSQINGLMASSMSNRIYSEGVATVIIGKPNVGKSSLLNALLSEDRVIVTDMPGTTRDSIEESMDLNGIPLRIIDTAGLRHPKDKAEEFGVERTENELQAADLVLIVVDGSQSLNDLDNDVIAKGRKKNAVLVLNKMDLGQKLTLKELEDLGVKFFWVSAKSGEGIEQLKKGMFDHLSNTIVEKQGEGALVLNVRHTQCLEKAKEALQKASDSCAKAMPVDFITIDLKESVLSLGEITGELVSQEVLNTIFSKFCVGK